MVGCGFCIYVTTGELLPSLNSVRASAALRWLLALAVGLGLVAIASPAYAADRSDLIDRSSITIVKSGSDPDAPLNQWNQTEISFKFTSQGKADPSAGDTFSLKLPDSFRTSKITFEVADVDGTILGSCTTTGGDGSVVTCTLNEEVESRSFVEGTVWLRAQATKEVSEENVNFEINGEVVPVDLPGEGGIGPDDTQFPEEPAKWGWFTSEERKNIVWTLFVPGDAIGTADPFVITDQLGPNQTMLEGWFLQSQDAPGQNSWTTVASSAGDPRNVQMELTDTGFTMSIPRDLFDPSKLYRIQYVSQTTTSGDGETYTNTASFDGLDVKSNVTREFEGGGDINGPGFGSIGVQKLAVAGEGAGAVPADTTFTVQATYQEDGQQVTKEIALTAGGKAGLLTNIPTGTVVTLSEIKLPAIDGITWGQPKFAGDSDGVVVSADGTTAQVTVPEQQTVTLSLTNTASVVTTTPPTTPPTTTPPPTTPPVTTPPGTTPPVTTPPGEVCVTTTPSVPGTSTPIQPGTSSPAGTSDDCGTTTTTTSTGGTGLAKTGSNLDTLGGIAAGLVIAGAGVTLAGRRRSNSAAE